MVINRRQFLRSASLGSVAALLGVSREATAAPAIVILDTRVISRQPQYYHGWPTLARRRNGQLLLVYSGGREQHVCPFGRVELMASTDGGQSWSWPQVLLDTRLDDRDAGVLETAKGSLLVTTFTSLAYEPILQQAEQKKPGEAGAWPAERLSAWRAARDRLNAQQRRSELGEWMIRSTDDGVNWSALYPTIVNSPHGPIQLADGRLLYAGKELWTERRRVVVCESRDDGQTWQWLAEIAARPDDDPKLYCEPHAVETGDGKVLVWPIQAGRNVLWTFPGARCRASRLTSRTMSGFTRAPTRPSMSMRLTAINGMAGARKTPTASRIISALMCVMKTTPLCELCFTP